MTGRAFLLQMKLLLMRECLRVNTSLVRSLVSYWIVWPIIFAGTYGYLMPIAFFGTHSFRQATEILLGVMTMRILVIGFVSGIPFFQDRDINKSFEHQVVATSFEMAYMGRLMWGTLFGFFLLFPLLPVAKLLIGDYLVTDTVSWMRYMGVLLLSLSMGTSYFYFWVSVCRTMQDFESVWKRALEPLVLLGGTLFPVYAIAKGIGKHGWILWCNPFAYMSDAFRQVFIPGPHYMNLTVCCVVMAGLTIIFSLGAYYFLKRRMDLV